jgi:FkbM family methyltransferase
LKKIVRSIFNLLGLQISRKQPPGAVYDYYRNEQMIRGLEHSRQRGLQVNTIVDVGAAEGSWSRSAAEYWPDATYVLFEPLAERKQLLQELCSARKNFHFISAAAGKETGLVNFHVASDLDGSGVSSANDSSVRPVEVTSIDLEVKRLQLKGPYIVKLDTHGYELPIIEGCSEILPDVSLFIIECYGFQIANGSLLFWEMCRLLDEKGFRLIEIVDVINRPKDQAFWQCDAFFVPANLGLFKDNAYQ